jgi:23S rRNA (cytosine1962-C5)-methyltransferase
MSVIPQDLAPLRLKRREEQRLKGGHLWVFSNEIDVVATPLKDFEPGQAVTIESSNGKFIGTGYVNPHSLIAVRLLSRDPRHPPSASLLVHRIKVALALRQRIYPDPYYRLIYGEGDGLPGLVVDRYGEVLVAQITTAGMERMRDDIVLALDKVVGPRAVLWRNDSRVRELEGLARYVETAAGTFPEQLEVHEYGALYQVSARHGQKTGWYFDQHDNRGRLGRFVSGRRVLDLFSYVGAWGIRAALCGAKDVTCVDASAEALEYAMENARSNGVQERLTCMRGDVRALLEELQRSGERFDVVIVDPPAFIKRRKDLAAGQQGYRRLNELAMRVLTRDGLLVSCSCSGLLEPSRLSEILLRSARHLDRTLQILEQGHQAADHPVQPAIPETAYLKSFTARVLPV